MKIKLGSKIIGFLPGVSYTVMIVRGCQNLRKVSSLSQLLRGTAAVAKNDIKKAGRKELFERITGFYGPNGETFLESYHLENRLKKVLAGKDIEGKNNLVNLIAWLSLKYFLPLFGFDLDQAEKDHLLTLYTPKKGKKAPDLDFVPETRNLVLYFPNLAGWSETEIDSFVGEINLNLGKYFQSGIAEIHRLDGERNSVDLGYQSELEQAYLAREAERKEQEEALATSEATSVAAEADPASFELPENVPDTANTLVEGWLREYLAEKLPQLVESAPNTSATTSPTIVTAQPLIELEIPREPGHGDLSTNLAMKLAKTAGRPPQEIAREIVDYLQKRHGESGLQTIEKIETVGPGFINFHLSDAYFRGHLDQLLGLKDLYGRSRRGLGQKIMVEFGSLNIAKPFGAHHFLTTVIGQTLVNLYRHCGYEVLAGDYPGDWGTQFGKSIYAYRRWGDKDTVEKDPMNELLKLYVKFHEEAEKDPSLEESARQEFQKLEAGDPENLKLWQWLVEVSTRDLNEIYRTMGVHHDRHYPESKYNQACRQILDRGKQLGVITAGEKGAYIVNLEEHNLPPALVQKGDGTTLYITRDIASIEDRLTSEPGLQRLVYVVDMAQTLHFQQLFAVAEKLHRADPSFPVAEFKHVPFGRMSFADASMSTRKGNIIQGRDIIREAGLRAEQIVQQKMQENGQKLSAAETRKLVHGLAIGAIKYAMLCQAPESDFTFDWDRVISLDGNSAPYLQYSLARAHSILRRAAEQKAETMAATADAARGAPSRRNSGGDEGQITLFSLEEEKEKSERDAEQSAAEEGLTPFSLPAEQTLLRLLVQYPEKLAAAAENYKPNLLTTYLHELAQTFNSFYSAVPVLKSQRDDLRAARLDLVRASAQVLKNGLHVLGIATFERM